MEKLFAEVISKINLYDFRTDAQRLNATMLVKLWERMYEFIPEYIGIELHLSDSLPRNYISSTLLLRANENDICEITHFDKTKIESKSSINYGGSFEVVFIKTGYSHDQMRRIFPDKPITELYRTDYKFCFNIDEIVQAVLYFIHYSSVVGRLFNQKFKPIDSK